jgi:homospermidine synthase
VQHQNATTLQVAASLLAAIVYAIRHPNADVCTADDLDSEEVLAIANPYLSPCESRQTDWRPPKRSPGRDGLWQFANFEFKQEAGKDANTTTFANHATTSLSRGHKVVDAVCQRAL